LFETIKISRSARRVKIQPAALESFDAASHQHAYARAQSKNIQPLHVINEEAVHEAFNNGMEEGRRRTMELLEQQYAARLQEELTHFDFFMQGVQQQLQALSHEVEESLLRFAVGVAGQIVRKEIETKPEIIVSLIKESIKKIVGVEKVKVRVNPIEMKYVQGKKAAVHSVSDSLREITFEADDSVETGGCIIESDIGNVDARISTQIEQVKEILFKH